MSLRWRQKPPTKDEPGLYLAVPVLETEATAVLVESDSEYVRCVKDSGQECPDYDEKRKFVLWYGPIKVPAFKYPKRWIHGPPKFKLKPLPPSCRRWGHKWEEYTPKQELFGEFSFLYSPIDMRASKHFKCSRCWQTRVETFEESFGMAIAMSRNAIYDDVAKLNYSDIQDLLK